MPQEYTYTIKYSKLLFRVRKWFLRKVVGLQWGMNSYHNPDSYHSQDIFQMHII